MFSCYKKWRQRKKSPREVIPGCPAAQEDCITLSLPMLDITLTRKLNTDVPHEVSVIVPRAEIRYGGGSAEWIYSSITVVHAPRHPLAGEQPPGAEEISSGGASFPLPAEDQAGAAEKKPPATGAAGELSVSGCVVQPSVRVYCRGRENHIPGTVKRD